MTLDQFRTITRQGRWGAYATLLLDQHNLPPDAIEQFRTYWIEAGHHMREQIRNDRMLVRLLRHLLPYEGEEALNLFRGENRYRWESGVSGLAWTTNLETARMFASGLNAVSSGGVLLKVLLEPAAIISGPNDHSSYLGESQFTVDPFAITAIFAMEFFPAIP